MKTRSFSMARLFSSARVVEPDGAVVVPGEEIAQHLAAGGLIGLDADETRDGRSAREIRSSVSSRFHLPGGRPVALARDLLPGRHLAVSGRG